MNKLIFTIDSFIKIGVKNNYKYKINALYYKSLAESIDYYLLANTNFGFQKGNSYTCNIIKIVGQYAYIDNIEQIDIDVKIKNKYLKLLKNYLDEDKLIRYLSFNNTKEIENEINSSYIELNKDITENILNAYYSNYITLKLNNLNIKFNENLIEELLNKYKDSANNIKELFERKSYYFAYYFNIENHTISKLNSKDIKYIKVINSLKKFEKHGHAFADLKQLTEDLTNNGYDKSFLINDIKVLESDEFIIQNNDKIFLKYNYDVEMSLINNLRKRINIKPHKLNKTLLDKVYKTIRKVEINDKLLLNNEQIEAICNTLENNITIITGGAGVGKSTIQNCIIRAIKEINNKSIVKVVAPTGKAVNELNKKIKYIKIVRDINTKKTIKVITPLEKPYIEKNKQRRSSIKIKVTTIHKLFNIRNDCYTNLKRIDKIDYLIIDEASMIDNNLFNAILSNIPITCKVIIVGDVNQCEAIGVGTPMINLLNLKDIFKTIILKDNYRQAKDSIIKKNSDEILKCSAKDIKYINNEFYFLEAYEKGTDKKTQISLLKSEVNKLIKSRYSINDIMILAYSNSIVDKVNSQIQSIYLNSIRANGFVVKDKVINTKNSNNIQKGVDAFNGEQGTISYIEEDNDNIIVDVDFEDKRIRYNKSNISQLKLAYGLTIHKCQGAKSKVVILLINDFDLSRLNRNIIYTALTRATEKVIIIGNKDTFNKCVCKLPEPKNSCLYEELVKYDEASKIV